jgi:hypothetical protein
MRTLSVSSPLGTIKHTDSQRLLVFASPERSTCTAMLLNERVKGRVVCSNYLTSKQRSFT